jgi:hypothetical protein
MNKKRFYYLFLILVAVVLVGAGCLNNQETNTEGEVKGQATVEEVADAKVNLTITAGETSNSYELTGVQDYTVLDVLQKASEDYDIALEVQDSEFGAFVQSLSGKTGGDDGKYWMYYVNGEMAPLGVGEQIANDGDQIEFKFE